MAIQYDVLPGFFSATRIGIGVDRSGGPPQPGQDPDSRTPDRVPHKPDGGQRGSPVNPGDRRRRVDVANHPTLKGPDALGCKLVQFLSRSNDGRNRNRRVSAPAFAIRPGNSGTPLKGGPRRGSVDRGNARAPRTELMSDVGCRMWPSTTPAMGGPIDALASRLPTPGLPRATG